MQLYEHRLGDGSKVDLEALLSKREYSKGLLAHNVLDLIYNATTDKNIELVRPTQMYFRTKLGKRYHVENCPYCKGRELFSISDQNIISSMTACACIEKNMQITKAATEKNNRDYMTAFVDESLRANPACFIDPEQPSKQNVISHVIMKGNVLPGTEVDNACILEMDAALASFDTNLVKTVYEAFAHVMMRVAFGYDFRKNLIIYSDSKNACDMWDKVSALKYLSGLYESVKIEFVPRRQNALADKVGREVEFMKMGKHRLEEYMSEYEEMQENYKELRTLKKQFSLSAINISNLFEELRLISNEVAARKESGDEI